MVQKQLQTRIPALLTAVFTTAMAVVSIVVALSTSPTVVATEQALDALDKAGQDGPVILTNTRHEEIVWASGGAVGLTPPWRKLEAKRNWTGLAHDPVALPDLVPSGEIAVVQPWAARRYGPAEQARAWRLTDDVGSATVVVRRGEFVRQCDRFRFGRHLCGPNTWNFVGADELVVAKTPTRCLWMHPIADHELHVSFEGVLGARLEGRSALSDEVVKKSGAAVNLRVEIDGEAVYAVSHENRPGWRNFRVPLPDGGPHEVTFVVSAAHDGARHFCVQASAVRR